MPTPNPARSRAPSVGRGILWMLLSMLLFVGMDTIAKYLTAFYPVTEVVWARFLFHLLPMLVIMGRRFPVVATTRRLNLQLLRALMVLLTTFMMISALRFIPLADANALVAVSPIFVTALSVPLLGEQVGPRRWAGVAIGFLGALIIIRPGLGIMHPAAVLPLTAALLYAVNQLTTRRLAATDDALTTVFYTASFGVVTTSLIVPFVWVTPTPEHWAIMIAVGFLSFTGHYASAKAFSEAPAATVTPFNYSALIWAALFGFIVFGDLPDFWTVVGAAIIVSSSLYILHRGRMRDRSVKTDNEKP